MCTNYNLFNNNPIYIMQRKNLSPAVDKIFYRKIIIRSQISQFTKNLIGKRITIVTDLKMKDNVKQKTLLMEKYFGANLLTKTK